MAVYCLTDEAIENLLTFTGEVWRSDGQNLWIYSADKNHSALQFHAILQTSNFFAEFLKDYFLSFMKLSL